MTSQVIVGMTQNKQSWQMKFQWMKVQIAQDNTFTLFLYIVVLSILWP